ncbi:hypothetical protein F4779DRAFT_602621 [Xylariaceae sp. FL0662B]|nr:hypothetical protein F4779DRAFT_602621 [Xylariaceae sp. FL0662B]
MLARYLPEKASLSLVLLVMLATHLGTALGGLMQGRQVENATSTGNVVTVTGYAHPLSLTALGTLDPTQTPLTYPSPPTPIMLPTRPVAANAAQDIKAQETPAPSAAVLDDASSVCTSIGGDYPTATIPNFCAPSVLVNAASFLPRSLPTATATIGGVSNKLDCCVQCADMFNCVAWKYKPVYTKTPDARLPGGFDPWGRGDCEAIYYVGSMDENRDVVEDGAPSLCPNGKVGGILDGTTNGKAGSGTGGYGGNPQSWTNLYYNGWNEGACGEPVDPFRDGQDAGTGDADSICSESAA